MPSVVEQSVPLWPLLVYFIVVMILVLGMLGLSFVLGERRRAHKNDDPYESGMLPTATARLRVPADFYLIAMFFVIFDLETVFIVAWAVVMRDPSVGWCGYFAILLFIVVLVIGLVYLLREGALDWGPTRQRARALSAERQQRDYGIFRD